MRITEILTFGYRGRRDDRYRGDHDYGYDRGSPAPYGGYQRRSLEDRDTPLAKLSGSSL